MNIDLIFDKLVSRIDKDTLMILLIGVIFFGSFGFYFLMTSKWLKNHKNPILRFLYHSGQRSVGSNNFSKNYSSKSSSSSRSSSSSFSGGGGTFGGGGASGSW